MTVNNARAPLAPLQELFVHEAGHAFGAQDCNGCGFQLTAMDGIGIGPMNPIRPLPCDQELMWDTTGESYGMATCNAGSYGFDVFGDGCAGLDWCVTNQNCTVACGVDGCCLPDNDTGGGGGGGNGDGFVGGGCQTDTDCPGCGSCLFGSCYDDNSWCDPGYTCFEEVCYWGPPLENGVHRDVATPGGGADTSHAILIGLDGDVLSLTDPSHGVTFDFLGNGKPRTIPWTSAGSNAGWLVLDLNHNGRIDNAFEMFSGITKQPGLSSSSVSFVALGQYDLAANGGNGDGVIDSRDKVFSRLRVWVDQNHDGISQPEELLTMQEAGIQSIYLDYESTNRTDSNGNTFQGQSVVIRSKGLNGGSWAYDVALSTAR